MVTTKRERVITKHLIDLINAVTMNLAMLDVIMKEPSTIERGRRVAAAANALDIANDSAMHFGLDLSFKQIGKRKAEAEARAAGKPVAVHGAGDRT